MIKNYLSVAFRNIVKNKIFSIINISGLAIGMAVCILILLYVSHELSFDKFHQNGNKIFKTIAKLKFGPNEIEFDQVSKSFGNAVNQVNPEVESFARIGVPFQDDIVVKSDENHQFFEKKFFFSEPSLFKIFTFTFIEGNEQSSLLEPNSVVINEKIARKYFGNENPVGKILTFNKNKYLTVTGIFNSLPSNSTLDFDFIASLPTYDALMKSTKPKQYESEEYIGTGSYETYFMLNDPGSVSKVESTIPKLLTKEAGGNLNDNGTFSLVPFLDSHLGNNWGDFSNTKYISIFLLIAGIILLLALINYMSLTTARSSVRLREVGVRKVLGANRKDLSLQFYGESIIMCFTAFILALFIFEILRHPFYDFLNLHIDNKYILSPYFLGILFLMFITSALVAGSYPALILSKHSPIHVLKGYFSPVTRGSNLRRIFLIFQFTVSVAMIICSGVVQKQLAYLQTKKIGLHKEQVLVIPLSNEARKHYTSFRNDLKQAADIQEIGASSLSLFKGGWNMYFIKSPTTNEDVSLNNMDVDSNFLKILELNWKIKPENIERLAFGNDKMILNETAVEKLKITDNPIHKSINFPGQKREIAGVLKDFNFTSLQQKIDGMMLVVVPDSASLRTLYVRLSPKANMQEKLASIEKTYKKYETNVPFDYYFLDDAFNKLYQSEQRMSGLFAGFTGVAIFIACLGLFGLIAFTSEQKAKEIGIRKVIGASTYNIFTLLSKDFIILVLIANGFAFPISYYFINKWLQGFAYKTDIGVTIFVFAGMLSVIIAFVTISFQAIRAAIANPIKSLRTD